MVAVTNFLCIYEWNTLISIECESVHIGTSSGIKKAEFIALYQFLKLFIVSNIDYECYKRFYMLVKHSNIIFSHLIQSFTQHVNNLTIVINMLKILNPT